MPRAVRAAFWLAPVLLLVLILLPAVLPDRHLRDFMSRPFSPVITDRNGIVLQTLPLTDGLFREHASLDEIPEGLVSVFYRSEDERFYSHPGVDPVSIVRAIAQNAGAGEIVSGGSTITMQLARTVTPHSGGVPGKLLEMAHAVRLEMKLSKDEVLEAWLNSVPFGSQIEGVASAAGQIFGLPMARLTTEQILLLAVVPRRPATYDPRRNPQTAADAAFQLALRLQIPVDRDSLGRSAVAAAERAANPPADTERLEAPHFVRYVARRLTDQELSAGTPIRTTLDLEVQHALEAALRARVESSAEFRIGNGAGIVLDSDSGEILAYVGSVNYLDTERSGQVDGVQIRRQPGSTLKPFLYSLAIERGFTASSILPDIPTEFGNREIYVPENFNRRFNGPVRLRTALASSLNVPAVYTIERLGVSSFAEYLLLFGFDSLADQLGAVGTGLALGNAEVTLAELTRAFSVFVRDGILRDISWKLGPTGDSPGTEVMAASTAGIIRSILSDELSRVPGFGTRSILDTSFQALFKTGTSSQFNNIWALGSTSRLTVGIWMGNFGGETVIGAPGSSLPAAVAVEILGLFSEAGDRLPAIRGVRSVNVCTTSGMGATPNCPAVITELLTAGRDLPPCNWHTSPSAPVVYPPEYETWALERDYLLQRSPDSDTPARIVTPADGAVFYHDPSIPAEDQAVRVEVLSGTEPVQLYVNGAFLAEGGSPLVVMLPIRAGEFTLSATAGRGDPATATVLVR